MNTFGRKNGKSRLLNQLLEQADQMSEQFRIAQQRHLYHSIGWVLYGSEMFYIGNASTTIGKDRYLRNDGKIFPRMQHNALDSDGGTYFPTREDAQAVLDRYNVNLSDTSMEQ